MTNNIYSDQVKEFQLNLIGKKTPTTMFGLFQKKTPLQNLQDQYKKLMADAHSLSQKDRKASDAKYAEADIVAKEIEALSKNDQ